MSVSVLEHFCRLFLTVCLWSNVPDARQHPYPRRWITHILVVGYKEGRRGERQTGKDEGEREEEDSRGCLKGHDWKSLRSGEEARRDERGGEDRRGDKERRTE